MGTPTEQQASTELAAAVEQPQRKKTGMKKAMNLILEEAELVELIRVLMDDDAEGALAFLRRHFKGKARDLLEGG